jgi:hypothetical protein
MVKAKKFDSIDDFDFEPGSYCVMKDGMIFATLPCGENFMSDGRWTIENAEDETKITVSPSIFCGGASGRNCWHGYLRNGEFVEA